MWWRRKPLAQVTVDSSTGFRKGDQISINGGEGTFTVVGITSTTLTIKPLSWWRRLWRWVRWNWRALWSRGN